MDELVEHHAADAVSGAHNHGAGPKSRPIYDKSTSEATRELRDTSRRRRAAEEKLQQHLIQARDHVPHHHDADAVHEGPTDDEEPALADDPAKDEGPAKDEEPEGNAG